MGSRVGGKHSPAPPLFPPLPISFCLELIISNLNYKTCLHTSKQTRQKTKNCVCGCNGPAAGWVYLSSTGHWYRCHLGKQWGEGYSTGCPRATLPSTPVVVTVCIRGGLGGMSYTG